MNIFKSRQWITLSEVITLLNINLEELRYLLDEKILAAHLDVRPYSNLVICEKPYNPFYPNLRGKDYLESKVLSPAERINFKYLKIDIDKSFPRGVVNYVDENSSYCPVLTLENKEIVPVDIDDSLLIADVKSQTFSMGEFVFFKTEVEEAIVDRFSLFTVNQNTKRAIEADSEPAPKTNNSYLRLIYALAELATDGLTGHPTVDAPNVIAALKAKGISCPVGEKAIGNYLADAAKLSK